MSSPRARRPTSSSRAAAAGPPESEHRPAPAAGASPSAGPEPLSSLSATASTPGPGSVPAHAEFTRVALVMDGLFARKFMSFWLEIAQQPVSGRRKTDKDRRPVAPTPIVRLWIREHRDTMTPGVLINPVDIDVSTLVCAVDLVEPHPVVASPNVPTGRVPRSPSSPPPSGEATPSPPRARLSSMSAPDRGVIPRRSPSTSLSPVSRWEATPVGLSIGLGIDGISDAGAGPGVTGTSGSGGANPSLAETSRQGAGSALTPILRPLSRTPRASHTESGDYESSSEDGGSSKVRGGATGSRPTSRGSDVSRGGTRRGGRAAPGDDTSRPGSGRRAAAEERGRNLHGRLHIQPDRIIDMEGGMGLWFLFMDLSIRSEGTYTFHFRCFDRSATGQGRPPAPTLVECGSNEFQVFSPRNYRGRPPNTPLADHFNRQGFKLNTRKNERHASPTAASSPNQPE